MKSMIDESTIEVALRKELVSTAGTYDQTLSNQAALVAPLLDHGWVPWWCSPGVRLLGGTSLVPKNVLAGAPALRACLQYS